MLVAALSPASAWAILIESGGVQIGGYFVSDDGKTLKMRVADGGSEKQMSFERAKIKIIHQFDRSRLETLDKNAPKGYADLAESLAVHKADPEARNVAMRLFLIAAYLDKGPLGAKCLLRMSALTGSPAEARRCKAMAFLLDPSADASMLRVEAVKPQPLNKAQIGALQDLLKALQFYRTGELRLAKEVAERKGMDAMFNAAPGLASPAAFQQRCNDAFCTECKKTKGQAKCTLCKGTGRTVNDFGQQQLCTKCKGKGITACEACDGQGANQAVIDENLPVILKAELWALDRLSGGGNAKRGDGSWTSVIQSRQGQTSPAGSLSLETITEFDPRNCVYRGGVWRRE
jgi:hypothetical protein